MHLTAIYGSDTPPLGTIRHYQCDITSASSVKEVAASVRSTFGNPTILINNAGVATGLTILSSTDESVKRTFDVNTLSHFRLVREFVPAMVSANHGTIVTIASIAASISTTQIVDYSCSKSAALAFHEGLAVELKMKYKAPKVRTLCVCPSVRIFRAIFAPFVLFFEILDMSRETVILKTCAKARRLPVRGNADTEIMNSGFRRVW